MSRMRRASVDHIERFKKEVTQSNAEYVRDRRLSLTMMNCIWARNTDDETDAPVSGVLKGKTPEWLEGSLYRVGPGVFQVGNFCYNHPFDMTAVLHKYTLFPNRNLFLYQNKVVYSKASAKTFKGKRSNVPDPEDLSKDMPSPTAPSSPKIGMTSNSTVRGKLTRFASLFQRSSPSTSESGSLPNLVTRREIRDTCMENITFMHDEMFLLSDNWIMLRVDKRSLRTVGQSSIEDHCPVALATPHPHLESDGTLWNLGTAKDKRHGYIYTIFKFPPKSGSEPSKVQSPGTAQVVATIPSRDKSAPCFFHSFGITTDYIIFIEQPLFVESTGSIFRSPNEQTGSCIGSEGLGKEDGKEPAPSIHHKLKWRKKELVHIYLVDRKSGKVLPETFVSQPFFFFHTINSYQDKGNVIIDLVIYRDAAILNDLKFSHIERTDRVPSAKAVRIVLSPEATSSPGKKSKMILVKPEALIPDKLEFPRFNYEALGKKYQYFYALGNDFLHPTRVLKVDTESRDVIVWKEPSHFVSEPIFVANPNGKTEDDGVVLLTLLSASKQNSVQLVILEAENFTEMGRIRFLADGTVTEGFHGMFVFHDTRKTIRY